MKLAKYLADYLATEVERNNGVFDTNDFRIWLKQGIKAFESTEGWVVLVVSKETAERIWGYGKHLRELSE